MTLPPGDLPEHLNGVLPFLLGLQAGKAIAVLPGDGARHIHLGGALAAFFVEGVDEDIAIDQGDGEAAQDGGVYRLSGAVLDCDGSQQHGLGLPCSGWWCTRVTERRSAEWYGEGSGEPAGNCPVGMWERSQRRSARPEGRARSISRLLPGLPARLRPGDRMPPGGWTGESPPAAHAWPHPRPARQAVRGSRVCPLRPGSVRAGPTSSG